MKKGKEDALHRKKGGRVEGLDPPPASRMGKRDGSRLSVLRGGGGGKRKMRLHFYSYPTRVKKEKKRKEGYPSCLHPYRRKGEGEQSPARGPGGEGKEDGSLILTAPIHIVEKKKKKKGEHSVILLPCRNTKPSPFSDGKGKRGGKSSARSFQC